MRIVSGSLINFEFAIDDVKRLLKLHDAETKRQRGRPSRQIEVFKRAAIILTVTAWESFVEDTILYTANKRISTAIIPKDVQSIFNRTAEAWLQKRPVPP